MKKAKNARDDDGTSLGLPVSVNDSAFLLSDVLPVPFPRFGVDRLSDRSDRTKRGKVVALSVLVTETTKETDSGRSGVELNEAETS